MCRPQALNVGLMSVVLVTLSGCASQRAYPATWPDRVPTTPASCEELTGTYRDTGDGEGRVLDDGGMPLLVELLFPFDDTIADSEKAWQEAQVSLSFPASGVMHVIVSSPEHELLSRSLTNENGQVTCQAGTLSIRHVRWRHAAYLGFVTSAKDSLMLKVSRSSEHLVIQAHLRQLFFEGLMVPIVPWWRTPLDAWFRFERLPAGGEPNLTLP